MVASSSNEVRGAQQSSLWARVASPNRWSTSLGRKYRGSICHEILPIQIDALEGHLQELANRVGFAGGDDVVAGLSCWSMSHIAST